VWQARYKRSVYVSTYVAGRADMLTCGRQDCIYWREWAEGTAVVAVMAVMAVHECDMGNTGSEVLDAGLL